jgi:hypothetical protein
VVEGLAELVVSKLLFTAFVSPALVLWLCFRKMVAAKEAIMKVLKCNPNYKATKSLDTELSSCLMLTELAMVLGLAVPFILLLVTIAFAGHLAVFHLARSRLNIQMEDDGKPAIGYLCVSLLLGSGLHIWFFIDNYKCISGQYVVCIGIPVCIILGLICGLWLKQASKRVHVPPESLQSLQLPLLQDAMSETQASDNIVGEYAQDAKEHERAIHDGGKKEAEVVAGNDIIDVGEEGLLGRDLAYVEVQDNGTARAIA